MNNVENINYVIDKFELMSYFSPEIICVFAIVLNLFFYLFFKWKLNVKRISDFITIGAFAINAIIHTSLHVRNIHLFENFSFTLFDDLMVFDNQNLIYKIMLNLFFMCFILITYKITRKARFKTPLINSILLIVALLASILVSVQNPLIAFVLLDVCAFSIYKYASNMRIRKINMYCPDFLVMSIMATILFLSFYSVGFFIKDELQSAIINVCATLALLLKAGLFPVFNYTLNRHYKTNIAYSILLFAFLPLLGIFSLCKFVATINLSSEVYLISLFVFLLILIFTCATNAFKTKNLIKYFANLSCVYFGMIALAFMVSLDSVMCINAAFGFIFCLLAFCSMLCVLKINLKDAKINFSTISGLFIGNRGFCAFFSVILLLLLNVIPSSLMMQNISILKGIYLFDKTGSYLAFAILLANIMILYNGVFAIKMCYTKVNNKSFVKLTKGTILNYIVPFAIILFLLLKMFL